MLDEHTNYIILNLKIIGNNIIKNILQKKIILVFVLTTIENHFQFFSFIYISLRNYNKRLNYII